LRDRQSVDCGPNLNAAQQRPGGVATAFGWLESLKTPSFQGRAAFGYPDSAEKQGLATTKAV
jgi:hypothetical protein